MKKILIFKTNIKTRPDVHLARQIIDSFTEVINWSIDLDDWEFILRIEATTEDIKNSLSARIRGIGYICNELEE